MTPQQLGDALARLVQTGGDDNRLVVQSGHAWLVYSGAAGGAEVRCEAAPSALLAKEQRPSAGDVHLLRRAGFASSRDRRGLTRTYALGGSGGPHHPVKVADDAFEILRSVYGCDLDAHPVAVRAAEGDRDDTENPALLDAIRRLAREREDAVRQRMYRQMTRATFLVPLADDGTPLVFGELMRFPVFGAFTDVAAMDWWDARPRAVERLHGRALFPRMAKTGLGSLLINPSGKVGGELYRNEVEMLASALR